MTEIMQATRSICDYFVDEAGDPTLFDRTGRIVVGSEGCSRFFMLGLLYITDVELLAKGMEELRKRLLADPYFRKVPSMQPKAKKTALAFHATDDVPEVRREVFSLLLQHDIRFFAIVRDKQKVVEFVRQRNERDESYRYASNELYDYMTRQLFKERLHKHDEYNIVFARRGKSDRTAALRKALNEARRRFCEQWGITCDARTDVIPSVPAQHHGLQVVDYFLWATQRLYEKGEDRYVELL